MDKESKGIKEEDWGFRSEGNWKKSKKMMIKEEIREKLGEKQNETNEYKKRIEELEK